MSNVQDIRLTKLVNHESSHLVPQETTKTGKARPKARSVGYLQGHCGTPS